MSTDTQLQKLLQQAVDAIEMAFDRKCAECEDQKSEIIRLELKIQELNSICDNFLSDDPDTSLNNLRQYITENK